MGLWPMEELVGDVHRWGIQPEWGDRSNQEHWWHGRVNSHIEGSNDLRALFICRPEKRHYCTTIFSLSLKLE